MQLQILFDLSNILDRVENTENKNIVLHCIESVRIWNFLVRIQSKCGEIENRKTPNTDTFYVQC